MDGTERSRAFVKRLWAWFGVHKRSLPWRDLKITNDTQRAYRILVSEVMLQQTQVPRVVIIYKRFLEQFPTIKHLATASNKEVIVAWRGMGYNSRALRLRDAARSIVHEHKGQFPKEMDQLLAIKGIGNYTAAAIRNFAFNISTPCIDTNIRRIMHRVFIGPENADGAFHHDDKKLMVVAEMTLRIALDAAPGRGRPGVETQNFASLHATRHAAAWHAALMDFGSLVCTKRSPKCDMCPMAKNGLCKSAFRVGGRVGRGTAPVETQNFASLPSRRAAARREPGRVIAGKFVPNRIIRGRVIESLRDASKGMAFNAIGKNVAIDWSFDDHDSWLTNILNKLERDQLITKKSSRYFLS